MYLSKKKIKEIAEYINSIEKDMEYADSTSNHTFYYEARGAYFAALKMAELAGIKNEVHEMREKLNAS